MTVPPPLIVLIGFMGCGKSTVGAALAARLGVPFVDLDAEIETASGRSIRTWFETAGEAAFRAAERAALASAVDRLTSGGRGGVLALGGGAWTAAGNQALVAGRALPIWLDVSLETVRSRIPASDDRPLYRDPGEVARLFAARQPAYAQAALRIDANGAVAAVVDRIVAAVAGGSGPQAGDT